MPWAIALAALALWGCGGATDEAPPAATPSGVSVGAISAVGSSSVVVNGVQFEMAGASVLDNDGVATSLAALEPGMALEVAYVALDRAASKAQATNAEVGAELLGPVDSVDLAANRLTVLGQTVQVGAATVFSRRIPGGLAGVTVGSVVSIAGSLNAASGINQATRIDLKANAGSFRLYGAISALDSTAKSFTVGSQGVSFAGLAANKMPAKLANGQVVRVVLGKTPVAGRLVASRIKDDRPAVPDGQALDLDGIVTDLTSTESFTVLTTPVDASKARFVNKEALAVAASVKVQGRLTAGVLVADVVTVAPRPPVPAPDPGTRGGVVAGLNAAAKTFTVGDTTVDFSGAVQFVGGGAAELVNEVSVVVKGTASNDGTRLTAQNIQFLSVIRDGVTANANPAARTFTVNGTLVSFDFSKSLIVIGGCCQELNVNGTRVRVFGPLSADGSRVEAGVILVFKP